MSIGPINNASASVLDLMAVRPAAPDSRADVSRSEESGQDQQGGFDQSLRDSSSRQPSRSDDASQERTTAQRVDDQATRESDRPDQTADERGAASENVSDREGSQFDEQSGQDVKAPSQNADEAGQTEQAQGETPSEAQTQTHAGYPAWAKLDAQQMYSTAGTGQQAVDAEAEAVAAGAKQQAQASLTGAGGETLARGTAQANGPQAQAANMAAVQPTQQQGTQSQTAGGDAGGNESSAAAQAATANTASTSAGPAQAAFTLPDQPSGEARLPLNTNPAGPQVDAAKLVQAQPLSSNQDTDTLNSARLTRGLANAVQQRGGAVTLRLTPAEMGTVRIQMQITGTNVSASFHAESASAQTLLTQQLSQLRTSLETQGMNVERLSVQPMASASASQNASQSQNDNQQQQNQSQQDGANDGRSRGQYSGDSSGGRSSGDSQDTDNPNQNQRQAPRGFFDQLSDAAEPAAA